MSDAVCVKYTPDFGKSGEYFTKKKKDVKDHINSFQYMLK